MIPKIIIKDFSAGIQINKYKQITNGFAFSSNIDIFSEPGALKPYYELSVLEEASSPNDIQGRIKKFVKYNGVYYALDQNGKIYDYNNTYSGKWGLVHTDTNTSIFYPDLEVFNDKLFWTSSSKIGKFDGSTWSDSAYIFKTSCDYHPMCIAKDTLLIGDKRYVASLSEDDVFKDNALDLPVGVTITDIQMYGNNAVIAAIKDGNSYLYNWDLASSSYLSELEIKNEEIIKLFPWNNVLLVFCNNKGNIYQYNGAIFKKLIQLPDAALDTVYFSHGGVIQLGSDIVFTTLSNTKKLSQIWRLIEGEGGVSLIGLADLNPLSNTSYWYESLIKYGNEFMVGVYDSDLGARIATPTLVPNKVYGTGIIETPVYVLSSDENKVMIKGVEIIAEPMDSSSSIDVYYKRDQETNWQFLKTITYQNQNNIFHGIKGLVKTIQFKLVLKRYSKILEIRIY